MINATNQDLQGNLGQNDTAPRVVEMIGRETKLPDLTGFANFEGEWTIELRLDRATDRGVNVAGSCTPEAMGLSAYTSECIDGLFQFDPPTAFAGRDYTGVWLDDSTFIITTTLDLTEAMGGQGFGNLGLSELRAGVTGTVMNGARTANLSLPCDFENGEVMSCAECMASECNAKLSLVAPPQPPRLAHFVVEDADNADGVLSVGDQYLLTFDVPTDMGQCIGAVPNTCGGGMAYVKRLFTFSAELASDYSGEWITNQTFAITVTEVNQADVDAGIVRAPEIGNTVAGMRPTNDEIDEYVKQVRVEDLCFPLLDPSVVCPNGWAHWFGVSFADWQDRENQPRYLSDKIEIRTADGLSRETATPKYCRGPEPIDGEPVYTQEEGIVGVPQLTRYLEPVGGEDVIDCSHLPIALPVLRGNYGSLRPPAIIDARADDPDDLDEEFSVGDTVTLTLDMRTDATRPPARGGRPRLRRLALRLLARRRRRLLGRVVRLVVVRRHRPRRRRRGDAAAHRPVQAADGDGDERERRRVRRHDAVLALGVRAGVRLLAAAAAAGGGAAQRDRRDAGQRPGGRRGRHLRGGRQSAAGVRLLQWLSGAAVALGARRPPPRRRGRDERADRRRGAEGDRGVGARARRRRARRLVRLARGAAAARRARLRRRPLRPGVVGARRDHDLVRRRHQPRRRARGAPRVA